MQFNSQRLAVLVPLAAITALVSPHAAMAQGQAAGYGEVMTTVYGAPPADLAGMPAGPVVEGIISARNDDKMRVSASDGTSTVIHVSEGTQIKGTKGLFDGNRAEVARKVLINGLPVSVKTVRWGNGLVASEVRYKKKDLKIATMIHNGTAQGFADQAAATEALRARMGDIDKYNIKRTTNVYFEVGKTVLSARAKSDLCATAAEASAMDNAVMLVLGYTDSTGSEEVNQALSEKRASRVVNYLQQACGWKPYRMLTPTGMAEADPLADNRTAYGKSQNRRVSVNVLVSKAMDGL
jgi:OOP family OmpA-OmpF porin